MIKGAEKDMMQCWGGAGDSTTMPKMVMPLKQEQIQSKLSSPLRHEKPGTDF